MLSDWLGLPQNFKSMMSSWMEVNQPALLLSQLQGWQGFVGSNGLNTATSALTLTDTDQSIPGLSHTLYASARYQVNANVTALRGDPSATGIATSEHLPSSAVNTDNGFLNWSTPSNAKVEDGAVAQTTISTQTDYLDTTNFGFSIPSGSEILGIVVRVKASDDGDPNWTLHVQPRYAGADIGTEKTTTVSTASLTNVTLGSSTDTWSTALTAAQASVASFGMRLWGTVASGTAKIDVVGITLYTDRPWSTITITAFADSSALTPALTIPWQAFQDSTTPYTVSGAWQVPPGAENQVLDLKAKKDANLGGGTIETSSTLSVVRIS